MSVGKSDGTVERFRCLRIGPKIFIRMTLIPHLSHPTRGREGG